MTAVSTGPMRRGSAVVPSNDTGRKSPESPRGSGCRWRFDGRLTERQRGLRTLVRPARPERQGRHDHDSHDHRLPRDAERLRVLGHLARRTRRADRARGPPRRGRPPAHRWPRPARRATRRDAPGCGPAQLARRLRPGRRVHHRPHRRMGADPRTPDQGPRTGPPDALVGARRGRDRPGTYLALVEFPSYSAAMANSANPATDAWFAELSAVCAGAPAFRNLDVTRVRPY